MSDLPEVGTTVWEYIPKSDGVASHIVDDFLRSLMLTYGKMRIGGYDARWFLTRSEAFAHRVTLAERDEALALEAYENAKETTLTRRLELGAAREVKDV